MRCKLCRRKITKGEFYLKVPKRQAEDTDFNPEHAGEYCRDCYTVTIRDFGPWTKRRLYFDTRRNYLGRHIYTKEKLKWW